MKFKKLRLTLLRIKLQTNHFYDDIIFKDKSVKKIVKRKISEWIYRLQDYKHIKLKRFKDLFTELKEIIFPIIIMESYGSSVSNLDIKFVDNEGHEYYMSSYGDVSNYIIGRRNSDLEPLIDRDFHYKIHEDKTIELMATGAMKLKQDSTNDAVVVDFNYDYQNHITTATFKSYSSSNQMRIKYPTLDSSFDKKVFEYLLNINDTEWYYYDVLPILKWMVTEMPDKNVSISIIAEINGEISAEIDVLDGIVQKYVITKIIFEGEIRIFKSIFSKNLQEFLNEIC